MSVRISIPAFRVRTNPLTEEEKKIYPDHDMRRVETYDSAGKLLAVIYMRESREGMRRI